MTKTSNQRSIAQHATAAALAGLTTLTLLWGIAGLADGYRAEGALMVQSAPAAAQVQYQAKLEIAAPRV